VSFASLDDASDASVDVRAVASNAAMSGPSVAVSGATLALELCGALEWQPTLVTITKHANLATNRRNE
jgi:hypothetical protein